MDLIFGGWGMDFCFRGRFLIFFGGFFVTDEECFVTKLVEFCDFFQKNRGELEIFLGDSGRSWQKP